MEAETHDSQGNNLNPLEKTKVDPDAATISASLDAETMNSSNSDGGDENYEEDALADDADDDYYVDDSYIYADNDDEDNGDYMYPDNDDEYNDNYMLQLQDKFDKVDLPPGVEASFSFSAASPTSAAVSSPDQGKVSTEDGESLKEYKAFKSFDVVDNFPDHNFYSCGKKGGGGRQPTKSWTKKVQDDWRILEKDLPDTIFVRVCEARMDLMRAAIAGPEGTPYHDGLFLFDIYFPPEYPQLPPKLHYYSGGLRLNPNLYATGKVCLSLLNTWTGSGCEKWNPLQSTMLQVLVSIQALILNEEPFFNEPGYSRMKGPKADSRSTEYSEGTLLLSLKTMIYTIRKPPKHFKGLVDAHFRVFAHRILAACKAYLKGAPVGSVVNGEFPIDKRIMKLRASISFNIDMANMVNMLVPVFSRCGAKDCERFLIQL